MLHLAIFTPGFIDKIFTGQKTIDGRFSKIKCMPFGSIETGDLVLMKKSGGKIVGYFVAGKVEFFHDLTPEKLRKIVKRYWDELSLSNSFWITKRHSKYLTLIEIKRPTKFRIPITVRKKDLSGWVSLGGESQRQIQLF
ncbi:hypothetical protein JW766_06130 [Candidatus Dojkabacteria bacterium]|nr:hypothetical protein [Candidatus Dojkabacteria bacterium]